MLHDRPPAHFHRSSPSEAHDLFLRLQPALPASFLPSSSPPHSTPFTSVSSQSEADMLTPGAGPLASWRADRPALLVSSTSWTPDEDFGVLLDALAQYELRAREGRLPKVLMMVTGKGPQRAEYMQRIARMQEGEAGEAWRFVRCVSLWLEAEDYPILLGASMRGCLLL